MGNQTGTEEISLIKEELDSQNTPTSYRADVAFAHEFTGGEEEIDFANLNLPDVAAVRGFSNLSPQAYIDARIAENRASVFIQSSSARGPLQRFFDYDITSNSKIKLFYVAEPGEVITGTISSAQRTQPTLLDVKKISFTGTLAEGATDVAIGSDFVANANPASQIGNVVVHRWQGSETPRLMVRCEGNDLANDGNYIEENGLIRFKLTGRVGGENITVFSPNAIEAPVQDSFKNDLQTIGGQVDIISEFLQDVHELPANPFQSAPNQIDLRAFGQKVIDTFSVIFGAVAIPATFLAKLKQVFGVTKYQTRFLPSQLNNVVNGTIITDLEIPGLKQGQTYRLTLQTRVNVTGGEDIVLEARNTDGSFLVGSGITAGNSNTLVPAVGSSIVFVAPQNGSITVRISGADGDILAGGETFTQVEELPNHVEAAF